MGFAVGGRGDEKSGLHGGHLGLCISKNLFLSGSLFQEQKRRDIRFDLNGTEPHTHDVLVLFPMGRASSGTSIMVANIFFASKGGYPCPFLLF